MIDWDRVKSVFLDMDGTLLDLHYDNHFWLAHVPRRYAELHGVGEDDARAALKARYDDIVGTMNWYCVDYWSRELDLDIARLKEEISHLIAVHPHVVEFLAALRAAGRRTVLVTNAHHKSLALKMRHTGLESWFDAIVCAHDLKVPKEHPDFWRRLQAVEPYDPAATLLIDDSLPVLRSARDSGIGQLLAVHRPDTRMPDKDVGEFAALRHFADILPPAPPTA